MRFCESAITTRSPAVKTEAMENEPWPVSTSSLLRALPVRASSRTTK